MDDLREYINKLRFDFSRMQFDESDALNNPFQQFEKWFREAVDAHVNTPNAMTLATASADGIPAARIMLLRNFNENGFVFYTNYNSRKAAHLSASGHAALLFWWPELERQVRIEGTISKQTASESDLYFSSRPDTSKLGAWSSPQSTVIVNRKVLDDEYGQMKKRFAGKTIERPPFWGGYVVKPVRFEFWQGRPGRMHDRIAYREENGQWIIERLAP